MSRKSQENPQLDLTPMIDVVFELIIFFVVTLTEAQKKDESVELEDGRHGEVITADSLPPQHLKIDIAKDGRISIGDKTMTQADVRARVKKLRETYKFDFPVLIRADYETKHAAVAQVMNACTEAGLWKLSFMAVGEDKTNSRKRLERSKNRGK